MLKMVHVARISQVSSANSIRQHAYHRSHQQTASVSTHITGRISKQHPSARRLQVASANSIRQHAAPLHIQFIIALVSNYSVQHASNSTHLTSRI